MIALVTVTFPPLQVVPLVPVDIITLELVLYVSKFSNVNELFDIEGQDPCPNPVPLNCKSLGLKTTISGLAGVAGLCGAFIVLGSKGGNAPTGTAGVKLGACLFTSLGLIPALTSTSAVGSDTRAKSVEP